MSKKTTIGIVTPSFNKARFLEHAIRSVLDQGYENLEYVIVDGGSTDGSLEIIRKYERHLAWWVSEPDRGQSDALNKGFKRLKADLVAWINADDYYVPGVFEKASRIFEENTGAGLIFGNGYRVERDGKIREPFCPIPVRFNLEALKLGLNFILQPATFFSRSALADVGYVTEDLHYVMDWDLWLKLAAKYRVIAVDEFLGCNREYAETKTLEGGFERWAEIQRMLEKHAGTSLTPGALCHLVDIFEKQMVWDADFAALHGERVRVALRLIGRFARESVRRISGTRLGFPAAPGAEEPPEPLGDQFEERAQELEKHIEEIYGKRWVRSVVKGRRLIDAFLNLSHIRRRAG